MVRWYHWTIQPIALTSSPLQDDPDHRIDVDSAEAVACQLCQLFAEFTCFTISSLVQILAQVSPDKCWSSRHARPLCVAQTMAVWYGRGLPCRAQDLEESDKDDKTSLVAQKPSMTVFQSRAVHFWGKIKLVDSMAILTVSNGHTMIWSWSWWIMGRRF
jgi:hypothetical protein